MKTLQMTSPNITHAPDSTDGETEGARRATEVSPSVGGRESPVISPPDPEVAEKMPRRKFTAKYKLRILTEADTCTESGQLGAILRREGLYFTNLTTWRRQRTQGLLTAMGPKKRGRKIKEKNPLAERVSQLEKETRQLQHKLKRAELIIEAQKKISEILGIDQNLNDLERSQ